VSKSKPPRPWSLRDLQPAWGVFVGVFLVRLVALSRLAWSPFLLPSRGDMHFYNDWALRIAHGQWTDHQAFYGLPLYAYLLAALYHVFGYSPFVPSFLQACAEGGTGALLYKLAEKIFNAPNAATRWRISRGMVIGFAAALGWAFFVPAQAYSVILMPTAWLVCIFWALVWQIVKRDDAPSPFAYLAFGLLIGVTAMGIATIFFVVPLLIAALFRRFARTSSIRTSILRAAASVALLVLGIGAGTSPAWLHNRFIAHDPVFLSAHSGVNFWIGNNPTANGYPKFPPGLHAGQEAMLKDSITAAEREAGHPLKRSAVSSYWSAKADAYVRSHFGAWLRLVATKAANFWNAFQYDDLSIITTLREEGVLEPGLRFGLVAALGLPGIVLAVIGFPRSRLILAAILLHMMSLLTVFVTERYRLAAVPGLLLFAAFGLYELWLTCATANYKRACLYLALLAPSVFFISIPKKEAALWALDSYNSGLQALESGHLAIAETKLNLAYAYVPDNAEINFALGNLRLARGDRVGAKSYYGSTLLLDSQHEGTFNNLGVMALEEKRWDIAAKFFAKARDQDPRNAKTRFLLAEAQFKQGRLDLAGEEIARALQLDPSRPELHALAREIDSAKAGAATP
jgi:Flp pilus assembly protein TadD